MLTSWHVDIVEVISWADDDGEFNAGQLLTGKIEVEIDIVGK